MQEFKIRNFHLYYLVAEEFTEENLDVIDLPLSKGTVINAMRAMVKLQVQREMIKMLLIIFIEISI